VSDLRPGRSSRSASASGKSAFGRRAHYRRLRPTASQSVRLGELGHLGQAIRHGSFTSVEDLIAAIEAFINGWNERCQPFTRTKTPDQLIPRCRPGKRTSFTRR
jgi:hypothetical protein